MDPEILIQKVILEGARAPFGYDPIDSLQVQEIIGFENQFCSILWSDKELAANGIADFNSLEVFIRSRSNQKRPVRLSEESCKALVILSHIYYYFHQRRGPLPESLKQESSFGNMVMISAGSDPDQIEKSMRSLAEYNKWKKLSENCILNAAYTSTDPGIWILAGRYYLENDEPDVSAALGYFFNACEKDNQKIGVCNLLVAEFRKERGFQYLTFSLKPYLDKWEQYVKKKGKKKTLFSSWNNG